MAKEGLISYRGTVTPRMPLSKLGKKLCVSVLSWQITFGTFALKK
jgi:hypothetical protein